MNSLPARVQGRYQVERELCASTELRRWSATDEQTGDAVELLTPRAHVLLRPGARETFGMVVIPHPAGLQVLARFDVEGTPVIARTLTQGTLEDARLSPDAALAAARWLVPAIVSAKGAFGGELCPDDIVLDVGGVPRLGAVRVPRAESLARVPFHRAPEMVAGALPTAAADLFGLGVTLYRAVSGVEPFPADSPSQLRMRAHDAPPLSHHLAVPEELDRIVSALITLSPDGRALVDVGASDAPPSIVVSRDADAPAVSRSLLPRGVDDGVPAFVLVTSLAKRTPAELRSIALRSGVDLAAVRDAAAKGLDWMIGTASTADEATRLSRRRANQGLSVRIQPTAAPPLAQSLVLLVLAATAAGVLTVLGNGIGAALFLGIAAIIAVILWRNLSATTLVARARQAVTARWRASAATGPEGRVWALEHRLRADDHLPSPLRADLLEAVEVLTDRLQALGVAADALDAVAAPSSERARHTTAKADVERSLATLELGLARTVAALAVEPESAHASQLGRLARAIKDGAA